MQQYMTSIINILYALQSSFFLVPILETAIIKIEYHLLQ